MLASRLIQSGKFLVFERTDLAKLLTEQKNSSVANELVGVDKDKGEPVVLDLESIKIGLVKIKQYSE